MPTDDTLTKAGRAADAKVVGDELNRQKQDLSELPKDVQINGVSILDDNKVANIPISSASTLGLLKVGASSNSGLFVHADGTTQIDPANNSLIANRATSSRPIDPSHLDYAVKAAMCDGKGAAWTAEEQAAARERIGIPGDYELIEKITLTEDVEVLQRNTYPDGTPYRLKNIIITAEIRARESIVSGQVDNGSNVLGSFSVNAGEEGFFKFYGDVLNYDLSLIDTKITTVARYAPSNVAINTTPRLVNPYIKLNNIYIRCNAGVLPSGSVITLYGVRA